jgi:hypothetical protein
MKYAASMLCLALVAPAAAIGQPAVGVQEMHFAGPSAVDALCACLLDLQRHADAQGRLDFTAEVASAGTGETRDLTARVSAGPSYAIGRIHFTGHSGLDDSTLRRAMTIQERDLLDVRQLRRSLERINVLGVFEPLTLADVAVARRDDGVSVDLTLPLRERNRRWWSVSGPMFPGMGMLTASVSARLPPWGRGIFEAATYFVSLNVAGFAKPFLALQRPVIPGQELISGFALSPALSPRATLTHYGRSHLAYRLGTLLGVQPSDSLIAPVTSSDSVEAKSIVCVPPKPRLWWLRRGAAVVSDVALAALIP